MDSNKLTIPPELFYSKAPSDIWKPLKSLAKISPVQITKKLQKNQPKNKVSLNVSRHYKKNYKKTSGPLLGRIEKVKQMFKKKKVKKGVLQVKSENISHENKAEEDQSLKTNPVKLSTKKQKDLRKQIKKKEESIQEQSFNENFKIDRFKGSSFKFFKSKNDRESEDESDYSDELVPDIRDFSASPQKNNRHKPEKTLVALDPVPFDDDDDVEMKLREPADIESLLKELDKTVESDDLPNEPKSSQLTLEGLIATLEGSSATENKSQENDKKNSTTE